MEKQGPKNKPKGFGKISMLHNIFSKKRKKLN